MCSHIKVSSTLLAFGHSYVSGSRSWSPVRVTFGGRSPEIGLAQGVVWGMDVELNFVRSLVRGG